MSDSTTHQAKKVAASHPQAGRAAPAEVAPVPGARVRVGGALWRSTRRVALVRAAMTVLLLVAGVCAVIAARAMQWKAFGTALGQMSLPLVGAALSVSTIQVFWQLARFLVFIPRAQRSPLWELLDATAVGQLLNYVTPLRSGDAYKLLRLFPDREASKGRFTVVLTALLLERVADVVALLVMTALAALRDVKSLLGSRVAAPVTFRDLAFALVGAAIGIGLFAGVTPRIPAVRRFLVETWRLLWSPRFVLGIGVAMIAWLFDAGTLWCTTRSGGYYVSLRKAMECVFVLNLGIAVPVTVGNLGIFEASLAFALSRAGIRAENALAIATLEHCMKFGGLLLCVGLLRLAVLPARGASRTKSTPQSTTK
jgi:uncharacterized membrane protein YbhN (UPF0104 family)